MSKKLLTIGMATYDDFDGVFFTIQSLRMHHPEVMDLCKFIIIDNNHTSSHGDGVAQLAKNMGKDVDISIVNNSLWNSTACRDLIFRMSDTLYTLSLDCHVLISPGGIKHLIEYFEDHRGEGSLIHGTLIQDSLSNPIYGMDPIWREGMYGTWNYNDPDPSKDIVDISMHGMGLFACETRKWLGYNSSFRGFGGEEGYIHDKYRLANRKIVLLKKLEWLHRFTRPNGIPYPNKYTDRITNYIIGWDENGKDLNDIYKHFVIKNKYISSDEFILITSELGIKFDLNSIPMESLLMD